MIGRAVGGGVGEDFDHPLVADVLVVDVGAGVVDGLRRVVASKGARTS